MNVVAIVQARMGSTRLPGKAMADIGGRPMVEHVVERARRIPRVDSTVVATTTAPADDVLARFSRDRGWSCFRGSEEDVLDRYWRAASAFEADVVVRITSDCPLVSPAVAGRVVAALAADPQADYAANVLPPRTFPRGLDVEAFTTNALRRAWAEDRDPASREHVTPYIYRNPDRFRLVRVADAVDRSHHRWTVDTPEDLAFVRTVHAHLGDEAFEWEEVLAEVERHPAWMQLNRHVRQREVPVG